MLTKLATALLLGAGLIVAIPATASAAGCPGVCGASRGIIVIPGSTTPGNPGSNNPGNTGPNLGCPNVGIVIGCNPGVNAPAAPRIIPAAELAIEAEDALRLLKPTLGWAPAPRTYVGLKTSLWIKNRAWATVSAPSPPVQGVVESVTATATPEKVVVWNLGETTIPCNGPGTPDGMSCSHIFHRSSADQPNSKYHITATITWTVAWVCTGNCDVGTGVGANRTQTGVADLPVGEIQTESTPG